MEYKNENELILFLNRAIANAYAGGNVGARNEEGFMVIEYREGEWYYVDRYVGFIRSWGNETVFYGNKPVWMQMYGGGMTEEFERNFIYAQQTFKFLMNALSAKKLDTEFRPRGPKVFISGNWTYTSHWLGGITKFEGSEMITSQKNIIFTHSFFGGLVLGQKE